MGSISRSVSLLPRKVNGLTFRFSNCLNRKDEEKQTPSFATEIESKLSEISKIVSDVHSAAPTHTLILISTGHGDTTSAIRALSDRSRRQAGLDSSKPWTPEDESQWAQLSNHVVQGLLFAVVKAT